MNLLKRIAKALILTVVMIVSSLAIASAIFVMLKLLLGNV
jgi:hypothetical protein